MLKIKEVNIANIASGFEPVVSSILDQVKVFVPGATPVDLLPTPDPGLLLLWKPSLVKTLLIESIWGSELMKFRGERSTNWRQTEENCLIDVFWTIRSINQYFGQSEVSIN